MSGTCVVDLPTSLFGAEAAKRAAYVLMARASVAMAETDAGLRCTLKAIDGDTPEALDRDFRREVLDQELRLTIEAQTAATRDAVLGLAFSRTGLQA